MTADEFLARPLVCIGGDVGLRSSYAVYMHQGFDHPMLPAAVAIANVKRVVGDLEEGQVALAWGLREEPFGSWPIYVTRRTDLPESADAAPSGEQGFA